MMHIHLLDTAISSDNIGDEIIVDHLTDQLYRYFPDAYFTSSSSHDGLGVFGRKLAHAADLVFLLGTNALHPEYRWFGGGLWPLKSADIAVLENKVVLFGVGAIKDFETVQPRQRRLLQRVLKTDAVHFVRDDTALKLVKQCGLQVKNGSCPTLWSLNKPLSFPTRNIDRAVFSLTYYRAQSSDADFVAMMQERYSDLHFWAQQIEDIEYLQQFPGTRDIPIVAPNLRAYDAILQAEDCDVIGSRLHGGIRALHHGRRSVVIAVDNRARDIGRETSLPVIAQADVVSKLDDMLSAEIRVDMSSLTNMRDAFFSQFASANLKEAS